MIPKYQRKTIGELQHEYLTNLLQCNKKMTIGQAQNRVRLLNQYTAGLYINLKG